jgi:O-antigen/teichoic acid export membrane protein
LATSIVLGLVGFGYMWKARYFRPSINSTSIKEILRISLPTIPHILGIVIIGFSDRLFIDSLVGRRAVGLYDVGYKIGMITMLFSDAFMKSWTPWFFRNISSEDDNVKLTIVRRSYLFMIGMIILAWVLSVGMQLMVPYFLDAKFLGARQFIFWIALAYAIRGTYQVMQPYLLHHGRMKFLAANTFVAVIVNLVLNYYLVTINGPVGAAQASVVAFICMSLGTWWYAQKIHSMPWFSFKRIFDWR